MIKWILSTAILIILPVPFSVVRGYENDGRSGNRSIANIGLIGLLTLLVLLIMTQPPAKAAGEMLIIDARNREISVKVPVRRIAVLPSDALEVIRILGAADLVAGVNNSVGIKARFWPEFKDLRRVGNPFEPNYEQIVSLWPDLVLAYGGLRPGPELENKLLPLGIQVLRMDFFRLSTLVREVTDFGKLLGKNAEAEAYVQWHGNCLSILEKRLNNPGNPPKVYLESYTDYRASGPGSGGYEMGSLAGGNLVSSGFTITNPLISTEFIADVNPDVIVKMVSSQNSYGDNSPVSLEKVRHDLMQRPGWSYISAVRTGRVYAISSDIGPGPRGIVGVLYMAKFFYPESFRDIDIRAVHREYLERFQGVPYRGFYVYPEK